MSALYERLLPVAKAYLGKFAKGVCPSYAHDLLNESLAKMRDQKNAQRKVPRDNGEFEIYFRAFLYNEVRTLRYRVRRNRSALSESIDESEYVLHRPTHVRENLPVKSDLLLIIEWITDTLAQKVSQRNGDIFMAVFFRGFTYKEATKHYGVTEVNLRAIISRVRKKLLAAAPVWVIEGYPGTFLQEKRSGKTPRRGRG